MPGKDKSRKSARQAEVPLLVPLAAALDALYDGDVNALSAALSKRRYDQATLRRLLLRIARAGARIRGAIDHAKPEFIEGAVLHSEYTLGYSRFFGGPGNRGSVVVVAMSKQSYQAHEVRDQRALVKRQHAVEPRYRLIVRNIMVESGPLVTALTSDDKIAVRSRQQTAFLEAMQAHVPDWGRKGVKVILKEIEKATGEPHHYDVARRALGRKK